MLKKALCLSSEGEPVQWCKWRMCCCSFLAGCLFPRWIGGSIIVHIAWWQLGNRPRAYIFSKYFNFPLFTQFLGQIAAAQLMWRIFKKKLFRYSPWYAIFECPEGVPVNWRPGAWMAGVHGSLGVFKENVWYQEEVLFCVLQMKLSLHTANIILHRDLFLIQFLCRVGGYFLSLEMKVDIFFPLRCFSFFLHLLTLWLWNKGFFVLHISESKQ